MKYCLIFLLLSCLGRCPERGPWQGSIQQNYNADQQHHVTTVLRTGRYPLLHRHHLALHLQIRRLPDGMYGHGTNPRSKFVTAHIA